jgi:hypothetical protein
MNEQAIWKLASEGGMSALTVDRLALETGQNALELGSLYPEPAFMVLVLMEEIHNTTLLYSPPATLPTHDRLTELVMSHLDGCLAHRDTIRRLWGDLVSMPMTLLTLRPYLMKMVDRILKECGLAQDNLLAPVRLRAYFALFLYVLYTWVYDETPEQEHTLVVLDQGLKKLEDIPW